MDKTCMICSSEESKVRLLLDAPCGRHWVCSDDVASFFENATNNESLFPPKCCGQTLMLRDYEEHVPLDVAGAYKAKEQGEYAVLTRHRVYCAHPPCAKFLHPASHIQDPDTKSSYAVCGVTDCGNLTCIDCKTLIHNGIQNHECKIDENEVKFRQMVTQEGYQECTGCGAIIELTDACNHITCECGHSFCYVCGKPWTGLHGCPQYGRAIFDEQGYNQEGFHRETNLNRDGLTYQDVVRSRGEDENEDDYYDNYGDDTDHADQQTEGGAHSPLTPDQDITTNPPAVDPHQIHIISLTNFPPGIDVHLL